MMNTAKKIQNAVALGSRLQHVFVATADQEGRSHIAAAGGISRKGDRQVAVAAATLNARYFVIHPGPEKSFTPPSSEKMRRMELGAQVLDHVARRCRELGVGLVLENMLPHLLLGNIRDMLWMLGSMSTIDIGICLDTGHAALSGSLGRSMYKLSGHLELVHAHDNRGQNDDHLPPGRGTIDWHRLLLSLYDIDFHGGFILRAVR